MTDCYIDKNELLDMVERNNAKKPLNVIGDFGDSTLSCPNCEKPIVNVWSTRAYKPNFCHYCGQRFDWEVEE